jgi:hypothetical protein
MAGNVACMGDNPILLISQLRTLWDTFKNWTLKQIFESAEAPTWQSVNPFLNGLNVIF